jgi:hypothetical protein
MPSGPSADAAKPDARLWLQLGRRRILSQVFDISASCQPGPILTQMTTENNLRALTVLDATKPVGASEACALVSDAP